MSGDVEMGNCILGFIIIHHTKKPFKVRIVVISLNKATSMSNTFVYQHVKNGWISELVVIVITFFINVREITEGKDLKPNLLLLCSLHLILLSGYIL